MKEGEARTRIALRYRRVIEHRESVEQRLRGECTPARRALLEQKLACLNADVEILQQEERLQTMRGERRGIVVVVAPPTGGAFLKGS